jgi:DNA-binding FadR family transcriptional regulator
LTTQSASAAVAFIRQRIEDGTWAAGEQLPNERALSERFGVARNTLRRGLLLLEAEGVITRHVGRGTFVSDRARRHRGGDGAPSDTFEACVRRASPAEIMEVRLLVEPQAVELAALRATADDLSFLSECLRRSEQAPDIPTFERWDGALHERIVQSARIQLLSELYAAINQIRHTVEWGKLKERSLTHERRMLYQEQHGHVVGALRERDAARARSHMVEHLRAVQASFLSP